MTRVQAKPSGGYRSKLERRLATELKRAKIKFEYEPFKLDYVSTHTYTPDFVLCNGIILEAKGYLDPDTRSKMIAVKACNPDLDIRFVFERADNTLSKRSKTTYGQWATRAGFQWSDGVVPKEWAEEKPNEG